MKKKTQRIIVIVVAIALIFSVLMPLLSVLASGSVTQGDIDNIKDELAEVGQQIKETKERLSAVRGELGKAEEEVELIQGQIVLMEQQIYMSQRLMDQYDLEIQDKEEEILELEAQEAEQYEEFYNQVRWMEETGSVSYLSIFFEASSFAEMLDYAMLITDIMDYNDRIITRLTQTQQQLGEARAELQASREEQQAVHDELKAQKSELEVLRAEATQRLNEIAERESDIAAEVRLLAASEATINRQLQEAEKKYAEQLAAMQNTGDWYWPLPGRYKLSSLFGGRKDPITGSWSNHTGTDIPALSGEEIHAAQGGIVTTVNTNRYASSYGYYCIISHGNGKATLYAHMKSVPSVKEGQTVTKGQVIGYVGTTGRSTGNHLHFELRINGTRADVLTLYPGMTFTTYSGGKVKGG